MAYQLAVFVDGIECRDTESVTGPDQFCVASAVWADGTAHIVASDLVSINDGGVVDLASRPEGPWVLFTGTISDPHVAVVLNGFDVETRSDWNTFKEKASGLADDAVTFLGDPSSLESMLSRFGDFWSSVIDGVLDIDSADRLLSWRHALDLATPETPEIQTFAVRGHRTSALDYSGWDYTLHLRATITVVSDYGDLPTTPPATTDEAVGTKAQDWLGVWQGPGVDCAITPHLVHNNLFNVSLTETTTGRRVEAAGVAVQRGTEPAQVSVVGSVDKDKLRSPFPSGSGDTEDDDDGPRLERVQMPWLRGEKVAGSVAEAHKQMPFKAAEEESFGQQGTIDQARDDLIDPQPEMDHIDLRDDNARLEMFYEKDPDGTVVGGFLRYLRPVSQLGAAVEGAVQAELRKRIV